MGNRLWNKFHNTKIFVQNNDSSLVRDADGNWMPSGGTEEEYKLYLQESKDRSKRQLHNQETTDGQSEFLEGYVVDPKLLPEWVTLPKRFKCLRLIAPDNWQECEFECRARLVPVPKTQKYTGQAVEGYIRWTK